MLDNKKRIIIYYSILVTLSLLAIDIDTDKISSSEIWELTLLLDNKFMLTFVQHSRHEATAKEGMASLSGITIGTTDKDCDDSEVNQNHLAYTQLLH